MSQNYGLQCILSTSKNKINNVQQNDLIETW